MGFFSYSYNIRTQSINFNVVPSKWIPLFLNVVFSSILSIKFSKFYQYSFIPCGKGSI